MKAIRYNDDLYILKGYFTKDTFKDLMNLGVKYENHRFYIPVNVTEEVEITINVEFIDDNIQNFIYIGYHNPDLIKQSIISFKDLNGAYIYVFDEDVNIQSLKKIQEVPYFFMNMSNIQGTKDRLTKKLYLEDLLYNTGLNIEEEDLNKLLYSDNQTLYAHHIINRICLNRISNIDK
ncbi:hypothetical protein [Alkaliphilus sp. B6464]|uniref:hypothetical protein n=1 Tax=Alkaliphilus sp. B6464 TaxID=2731219 RepID=UPI001BACE485|nr:hypothetical protein [Alkaliphilus sp. B6464]QUH22123.1 hypothetical protein HYG84_19645 [Alkaliphilus sp. B6464]